MKLFLNLTLFISITFLLLQNQLLLAFVAVCIFSYRVSAAWLLPLAILIDGYFGAFSNVPVLSLSFLLWYILSEFIKPRLLVQS